jgi:hypothetical protein
MLKSFHHGSDPAMFNQNYPDPYPNDGRLRVLSVGQTLFDYQAAVNAASIFPE